MLSKLLSHPFWSGISGILAVIAFGFTIYSIHKDSNKIELPTDYVERKVIDVSLLAPSEWVLNKGHIESWGYIHPIDKEPDISNLSNLNFPFIYVQTIRMTDEEFDENAYPDENLEGYDYISMVPDIWVGELGSADRYRFAKADTIIERLHIADFYYSQDEYKKDDHVKIFVDCVVPKNKWDVFSKMCSKIIGSVKYKS